MRIARYGIYFESWACAKPFLSDQSSLAAPLLGTPRGEPLSGNSALNLLLVTQAL